MSDWDDASADIDAAFGVAVIYTGAGLAGVEIAAIRGDYAAPNFEGAGKTERAVTFEVAQADLPQRPTNSNTFTSGGVKFRVQDVTKRDDIGKWELGAVEIGPA
jgi:hypothetical protein